MARSLTFQCDGCGKQHSGIIVQGMEEPETTLPDQWRRVEISVREIDRADGLDIAPETLVTELCATCAETLSEHVNPNKWPRVTNKSGSQ